VLLALLLLNLLYLRYYQTVSLQTKLKVSFLRNSQEMCSLAFRLRLFPLREGERRKTQKQNGKNNFIKIIIQETKKPHCLSFSPKMELV
jgi:hypothetical protein